MRIAVWLASAPSSPSGHPPPQAQDVPTSENRPLVVGSSLLSHLPSSRSGGRKPWK